MTDAPKPAKRKIPHVRSMIALMPTGDIREMIRHMRAIKARMAKFGRASQFWPVQTALYRAELARRERQP